MNVTLTIGRSLELDRDLNPEQLTRLLELMDDATEMEEETSNNRIAHPDRRTTSPIFGPKIETEA